ncbi:MAG: SDR family oxidoreductase [Rhodobacteraceae bacterium]|nr:SDR family oxidoreductase [Paracoccaceae bacterium]
MTRRTRNGHRETALVAGGAGFVGFHLVQALLARGDRVICVDSFLTGTEENAADLCRHPDFRLMRHDVTYKVLPGEPVDVVYNLACAASPPHYQANPVHTMLTNVLGTANLLALAEANGARFVQASTSEVYGDPEAHPQSEDYRGHVNCTGARACYDEGKRAAEALAFDYLRAGRVDVRVARIFNTYGPRMRADDGRIVSNMIVQALAGRPMTIYGSGHQTRSFCFVSDLVRGLLALGDVAERPPGPVNLGNPDEFTVLDLALMVRGLVGSTSRVVHLGLPEDDPRRRRPDIGRAEAFLGWRPRIGLDRGLPETVRWFAGRIDRGEGAPPIPGGAARRPPQLPGPPS